MANGVAGVLVTPDLGVYNTVFLINYSFTEEGDYQRQYRYELEFVVHNQIPPVTRISAALQKTQIDLVDTEKQNVQYTIKSGDTLGGIASRFGMSLSQLKALNPSLVDAKHKGGNLIHAGEIVNIIKGTAYTEKPVGGKIKKNTRGNGNKVARGNELNTIINAKDNGQSKDSKDNGSSSIETVSGFSSALDTYIKNTVRESTSTLDKYRKLQGDSILVNADAFPSFTGIVAYGSNTTVDTKKSLSIDDSKTLLS